MAFLGLFSSRFEKNNEKDSSFSRAYVASDSVSHACHYDLSTLLTKNGELVQTIKIVDYSFSATLGGDLRSRVRESLLRNITAPDLSVWVHTVRRESSPSLDWVPGRGYFCDLLHNSLSDAVFSKKLYANDLYISIVSKGLYEPITGFFKVLSSAYLKKKHSLYLEQKIKKLQTVVNCITDDLKIFRATKLQMIDGDRSELLEFFRYLLTLRVCEGEIKDSDLAEQIIDPGISINFGFNVAHLRYPDGQNKFVAILGLKEYRDSSLEVMDFCLQCKSEFIVTEAIRFVNRSQAIKDFSRQIGILEISGDEDFAQKTGLTEIISSSADSPVEFCEHRISIAVTADNLAELRQRVEDVIYSFSLVGLTMSRYDLGLEDAFWAQLPGNFPYLVKPRHILSKYSCGFAMLHNFSSGSLLNDRWGKAITVFLSDKDRPYFFNFHVKGNGHAMVIGPPNSGRTLLINTILSESRRLDTKLVVLDHSGKSIIFVKAMDGQYQRLDYRKEAKIRGINPFLVEDNVKNRKIIENLLTRMTAKSALGEAELNRQIISIIDHVFSLPRELRSLAGVTELLLPLGGNIAKWCGEDGEFSVIFSSSECMHVDWGYKVLGFHTGVIANKPECLFVVARYILESLCANFDGSPTILVLDESWKLASIFKDEQEFNSWMQELSDLNVVVIFTTENVLSITTGNFTKNVEKHLDTKIFMPNIMLSKIYMNAFSLSKKEYQIMLQMPTHDRHFLIKQGDDSAILTMNLAEMREIHVLSANQKTIKFMHEAVLEKGDKPSDWLPVFYEKCQL